jgi:YqjK-like protein
MGIGRAQQLAERRRRLQTRSHHLRLGLALQGVRLAERLTLLDTGVRWLRVARGKPWLAVVATGALLALRPGKLLGWATRAALLTSLLRNVLALYRSARAGGAPAATPAATGDQPPDRFAS